MAAWTGDELSKIAAAEELQIAPRRRDGTLRKALPVWVVRHGDGLYVRSVNGPTAAWYRAAQATRDGHVHAAGVDKDVTFVDADHGLDDQIDAAYWAKYRHFSGIVPSIVTPQARSTTIKLLPHSNDS